MSLPSPGLVTAPADVQNPAGFRPGKNSALAADAPTSDYGATHSGTGSVLLRPRNDSLVRSVLRDGSVDLSFGPSARLRRWPAPAEADEDEKNSKRAAARNPRAWAGALVALLVISCAAPCLWGAMFWPWAAPEPLNMAKAEDLENAAQSETALYTVTDAMRKRMGQWTYDPAKYTWAHALEWPTLDSMWTYYSRILPLKNEDQNLLNIEDKVWAYKTWRPQYNLPQPPVVYADYEEDLNFAQIRNAVDPLVDAKSGFVMKPSFACDAIGLVWFDKNGNFVKINALERELKSTRMWMNVVVLLEKSDPEFVEDIAFLRWFSEHYEGKSIRGEMSNRGQQSDLLTMLKILMKMGRSDSKLRKGLLIEKMRPLEEINIFCALGEPVGHFYRDTEFFPADDDAEKSDAGKKTAFLSAQKKKTSALRPTGTGTNSMHLAGPELAEVHEIARKAAKASGMDLVRVDLVRDDAGKLTLAEITVLNSGVWTMVNRGPRAVMEHGFPSIKSFWAKNAKKLLYGGDAEQYAAVTGGRPGCGELIWLPRANVMD